MNTYVDFYIFIYTYTYTYISLYREGEARPGNVQ